MQIVLHVSGYYDWEPVPDDVEVTEDDYRSGQVKQDQSGKWIAKVEKDGYTHVLLNIPESELHEAAVAEMTRGDRRLLSREELAHRFATRHQLSGETHQDWIQDIEVFDGAPDEAGFRALLQSHVTAPHQKIKPRDVEAMVAKYLEPSTAESHVSFLREAYGVTDDRVKADRARRDAAASDEDDRRREHLKGVDAAATSAADALQTALALPARVGPRKAVKAGVAAKDGEEK